jgi:hypothetical protein
MLATLAVVRPPPGPPAAAPPLEPELGPAPPVELGTDGAAPVTMPLPPLAALWPVVSMRPPCPPVEPTPAAPPVMPVVPLPNQLAVAAAPALPAVAAVAWAAPPVPGEPRKKGTTPPETHVASSVAVISTST